MSKGKKRKNDSALNTFNDNTIYTITLYVWPRKFQSKNYSAVILDFSPLPTYVKHKLYLSRRNLPSMRQTSKNSQVIKFKAI